MSRWIRHVYDNHHKHKHQHFDHCDIDNYQQYDDSHRHDNDCCSGYLHWCGFLSGMYGWYQWSLRLCWDNPLLAVRKRGYRVLWDWQGTMRGQLHDNFVNHHHSDQGRFHSMLGLCRGHFWSVHLPGCRAVQQLRG